MHSTLWLATVLACSQAMAQPPSKTADDDAGYRAATGLLHRELPEQAAAEYRAFLRDHPGHSQAANARYGLAVCLTRLGRWSEAETELDALTGLEGFGFAPDALLMRAQCAAALHDPAGAAASLRTLLSRFPGYEHADAAAVLLGETLYSQDRSDDAKATLERVAKDWPQSPARPRAEFLLALVETKAGRHSRAATILEALRTTWPKSDLIGQATLLEAQCRHRLALADPAKPDRDQAERALHLYSLVSPGGPDRAIPEAILGGAQLTRAMGKPAEAGRSLDELLRRFADHPLADSARLERARAYLDEDQPQQALKTLDAIHDTDALATERAYWSAKCELKLNQFEAAAKRLGRAIARDPQSAIVPDMLYDRGWAMARGGEAAGAQTAFAEVATRFPSHTLAPEALAAETSLRLSAGEHGEAISVARRFLSAYPGHIRAASVQLMLADAELGAGHSDRAANEYDSFLRAYPDNPQARNALLRRGLALAKLGKTDEAAAVLSRAMAAKGDAEQALIDAAGAVLADAAMASGDWPGAEERLRAITQRPEGRTPAALLKLGIVVARAGRGDEAAAILDPIARDPSAGASGVQAGFERGQILVAQGKLDEARSAFELVIAKEENQPDRRFTVHALRHLAAIASRQGQSELAADLLGRVARSPDAGLAAPDAIYDQGAALLSAGKYEQAESSFTEFLRAAPDHSRVPDALAQQAIATSRRGQYDRALSLIQSAESRAAAIAPDLRAAMRYERAWALNALHRADEAQRAYVALLAERIPPTLESHAALDLAQLTIAGNDFSGALALLDRAESSAPSGDDSVRERVGYLRGLCQLKTDRAAEAAATLDEFLMAHPGGELAVAAGLLAGQAHLRNRHPELAVERLTKVVEASPPLETLGPALLCLGEAQAASQQWDQSQAAFERYLKESPSSDLWFQAQFGIGWALENQGHHAEAISAYRDVVTRHQGATAARAQFQIGECLFAQRRHEEAVREFLKVDILYAYPEWSAAALYEAGRCLAQLEKPEEARRQFQQVTDRFKDTEWANLAARQLTNPPAAPPSVPGSR